MTSNSKFRYGLVIGLVVFALIARLLPSLPNFAPIAAIAIFAGSILPKRWAIVLALAAIIVSDLFIGLHSTILWTWGSFGLIALVSHQKLHNKLSFFSGAATTIWASLFFYLLSNFGVWLQGGLYPLTTVGLQQSYINGLPFLRNTLLGDAFYSAVLFGVYFGVLYLAKNRTKAAEQA